MEEKNCKHSRKIRWWEDHSLFTTWKFQVWLLPIHRKKVTRLANTGSEKVVCWSGGGAGYVAESGLEHWNLHEKKFRKRGGMTKQTHGICVCVCVCWRLAKSPDAYLIERETDFSLPHFCCCSDVRQTFANNQVRQGPGYRSEMSKLQLYNSGGDKLALERLWIHKFTIHCLRRVVVKGMADWKAH